MKSGNPLLFKQIMLALGVFAVGAAIYRVFFKSKRKEQFQALAQHNGFEYYESGNLLPSEIRAELQSPHFIRRSDNARISNTLALFHPETDIRRALICDFHYSIGKWWNTFTHRSLLMDFLIGFRKNRTPNFHNQTVFACFLQRATLPLILIEPKNIINRFEPLNDLHRVPGVPGSHFSKEFILTAQDPEKAHPLFSPTTCDLIVERTPGFSFEMEGKWLFAYKRNRTVNVTHFPDVLDAVEAVAHAIYKSNVKQIHRTD